jgi:hypothetical protein
MVVSDNDNDNDNGNDNDNEEFLELQILSTEQPVCCVCLNTIYDLYVELHCCKQHIHKKCLIEWILNESNLRPKCPICRCVIYSLDSRIEMRDFILVLHDILNNKNKTIDKHRLKNLSSIFFKNEMIFEYLFISDVVEDDDINERVPYFNLTSAICLLILIILMINLFFML